MCLNISLQVYNDMEILGVQAKSLAHVKEKNCGAYLASVAHISAVADSGQFTTGYVHGLLLISVGITTSGTGRGIHGH